MSQETVTIEFPIVPLPPDHTWTISHGVDYWSVGILVLHDLWQEYEIVATSSDVDFNRAVDKCLGQLREFDEVDQSEE